MKWIGERISYVDHGDKTTIIITPESVGFIKALMGAWFFMWAAIGGTMIWALASGYIYFSAGEKVPSESEKQTLFLITLVFLVFWLYYFVRIGRMFFWLLWGREYLKIDKINMTIKTSIREYGKAKEYFLDNLSKVRVHVPEKKSFQAAWENSPWIRGGERLEFDYMGKTVRFGRKLNEQDSKLLFQLITKRVDEHLKKNRKANA